MKKILAVLPFILIVAHMMTFSSVLAEKSPNKMRMSQYRKWSVILNYVDVSNPLCQVEGVATSPDLTHAGLITIWRDRTRPEFVEYVHLEVVIRDNLTGKRVRLLNKDGVHQLGNEAGTVDGITRASPLLNPPVFLMNRYDFEKAVSPPNEYLTAVMYDREGNEITVSAPLTGIFDALDQCQIFRPPPNPVDPKPINPLRILPE